MLCVLCEVGVEFLNDTELHYRLQESVVARQKSSFKRGPVLVLIVARNITSELGFLPVNRFDLSIPFLQGSAIHQKEREK